MEDRSFCYIFHNLKHFIDCPKLRPEVPEVKTSPVESVVVTVIEMGFIKLAKHCHRGDRIQN